MYPPKITLPKQHTPPFMAGLLIASYAMLEDIYLLHNDLDFDHMKNNCKLKIYSFLG